MKIVPAIAAALASAAIAACTQGEARTARPVAPAAEIVGAAETCLPLTAYTSTDIRDDRTIDFIGTGGKVWRNTLSGNCPGLRSADAFTFETSLSRLCSTDIIYVLQNYGGTPQRGAGCGLGQFVPVRLAK